MPDKSYSEFYDGLRPESYRKYVGRLKELFDVQPLSAHRLPYTKEFEEIVLQLTKENHPRTQFSGKSAFRCVWEDLNQCQALKGWASKEVDRRPVMFWQNLDPTVLQGVDSIIRSLFHDNKRSANDLPYTEEFEYIYTTVGAYLNQFKNHHPSREDVFIRIKNLGREPEKSTRRLGSRENNPNEPNLGF